MGYSRRRKPPASAPRCRHIAVAFWRKSDSEWPADRRFSVRQAGHTHRMRLVPWIPPVFRDRAAAGRALSEAVAALELNEPVVVGVARGGVAVALEVARELKAPLTAIDVERVNAYGLRLGAVTAQGPPYLREKHGVPEA